VVETARGVFLNTAIVRERYAKRYPAFADKLHTLTNGYDEDDFTAASQCDIRKGDPRRILLYCGSDYDGFIPRQLRWLAGRMSELGLDKLWRIISAGYGDNPPESYGSFWSHLNVLTVEAASQASMQADLLLTAMPPGEQTPSGTVPLKTYSYLRTEKPIVYIGESGSTTDLLAKFAGTYSLPRATWPDLPNWLARHQGQLLNRYARPGIEEYSVGCLVQKLLGTIDRVIR
jgi:hypothetical protein